jgi:hypothetical protein
MVAGLTSLQAPLTPVAGPTREAVETEAVVADHPGTEAADLETNTIGSGRSHLFVEEFYNTQSYSVRSLLLVYNRRLLTEYVFENYLLYF